MASQLSNVPSHLLDELVEGSWLPIVGAGFSRNASVPSGDAPKLWDELGRAMSAGLDGVDDRTSAVEILSAFEQAFGRVALVDKVGTLVRAHDAMPGNAHLAFAGVGFDVVVTTNFDFLLERAYQEVGKQCLPILDETQLSSPNRYPGPRLIKMHGDVSRLTSMVVTERDYDSFLASKPVLATSIAAMLVERTGVLIGYSLDDPDMRQILAILRDRLGSALRPLWTIQVDAPRHLVDRYERRGVKVINLPRQRGASIGDQLERLFDELADYWRRHLPSQSSATSDSIAADLRLDQDESRICYFAVPAALLSWYRDHVFPEAEAVGLLPLAARDVMTSPGAVSAKLDTLISRAVAVIAEVGDSASEYEAALAIASKTPDEVLLIAPGDSLRIGGQFRDQRILRRPVSVDASLSEQFSMRVRDWLRSRFTAHAYTAAEAERLLRQRQYGPAVVSAVASLEATLLRLLATDRGNATRPAPLHVMVREAGSQGLFESSSERRALEEAINLRNETLHRQRVTTASEAKRYVEAISRFVQRQQR